MTPRYLAEEGRPAMMDPIEPVPLGYEAAHVPRSLNHHHPQLEAAAAELQKHLKEAWNAPAAQDDPEPAPGNTA